MSKFDELCASYGRAYENTENYLESCAIFYEKLIVGLGAYLECPPKRLLFRDSKGTETGLREALYLGDGFWRLDVEMVLCPEGAHRRRLITFAGKYYPPQTVSIALKMKRMSEDTYELGICGGNRRFTIVGGDKSTYELFFEYIYESVKVHFLDIVRAMEKLGQSPVKIGVEC